MEGRRFWPGEGVIPKYPNGCQVAVGESSVILLHPFPPIVGVSIGMERERRHNDRTLPGPVLRGGGARPVAGHGGLRRIRSVSRHALFSAPPRDNFVGVSIGMKMGCLTAEIRTRIEEVATWVARRRTIAPGSAGREAFPATSTCRPSGRRRRRALQQIWTISRHDGPSRLGLLSNHAAQIILALPRPFC